MSNETIPQGLSRFSRSMPTRYTGTCEFCAGPTHPGVDYAARNGASWIAVCATCAVSITEQVKGAVRRLQNALAVSGVATDVYTTVQGMLPATERIAAAMQPETPEAEAFDTLLTLVTAAGYVKLALVKSDPVVAGLRLVAANAAASAKDRQVATDMAAAFDRYGRLTERQASYAASIVARYEGGQAAPAAPAAPAEVGLYEVGDDVWWIREGRKSGNTYAMILRSERSSTGKADWEYVKGGLRIASQGRKDDGTIAAQLGHASHHCCFCGISLSDDGDNRSVKVGYGPVCAKRYSLPWG